MRRMIADIFVLPLADYILPLRIQTPYRLCAARIKVRRVHKAVRINIDPGKLGRDKKLLLAPLQTQYGDLINRAVGLRYDGDETQAVDLWKQVLMLDENNELKINI